MFRNASHLIRPAIVFMIGLAAFTVVRHAVVPPSFGAYGHYRGAALEEIRSRPAAFAGQAACGDCHSEVVTLRNQGKHKGLSCEACHGPSANHAADPTSARHAPIDSTTFCAGCHEKSAAKPEWFRQVQAKEHAAGEQCVSCHKPHSPSI